MNVVSRGVPLAVHDFGGPAGAPVLVWLHANGLAATAYTPFLRKVAQRARVFAMDLRGHGESGPVPLPLEEHLALAVLESDLAAVLQAVSAAAPPIHVAAHSVGGLPVVRHLSGADVPVASITLFEAAVYPPEAHPVRAEAEKLTAERVARTPRRRAEWPTPAEFADALAKAPAFASVSGATRSWRRSSSRR